MGKKKPLTLLEKSKAQATKRMLEALDEMTELGEEVKKLCTQRINNQLSTENLYHNHDNLADQVEEATKKCVSRSDTKMFSNELIKTAKTKKIYLEAAKLYKDPITQQSLFNFTEALTICLQNNTHPSWPLTAGLELLPEKQEQGLEYTQSYMKALVEHGNSDLLKKYMPQYAKKYNEKYNQELDLTPLLHLAIEKQDLKSVKAIAENANKEQTPATVNMQEKLPSQSTQATEAGASSPIYETINENTTALSRAKGKENESKSDKKRTTAQKIVDTVETILSKEITAFENPMYDSTPSKKQGRTYQNPTYSSTVNHSETVATIGNQTGISYQK